MPAIQALQHSSITEGVNLGNEQALADSYSGTGSGVNSYAQITFNSNGAVQFLTVGNQFTSNTAPANNWGNSSNYFSYQVLEYYSSSANAISTVTQSNSEIESSTIYGENRYLMSSNVVLRSDSYSKAINIEEGDTDSTYLEIKVSIWDSTYPGGNRVGYGTYRVQAITASDPK